MRPIRIAMVLGGLAVLPLSAAAQAGPETGAAQPVCRATANLPPEHFAARAARRAEELGLLTSPLPTRNPLSLEIVAHAVSEARVAAAERGPALERLTVAWDEELRREFPGLDENCSAATRLIHAEALAGYARSRGLVAPGVGQFPPVRTGARPIEPESRPFASAVLEAELLPRVGISLAPSAGTRGPWLERASVAADLGFGTLSLGREPVGYALGEGGGVVLSGRVALDRVELKRDRAARLPGWLGVLGPVSYEAFLARLNEPDTLRSPYFLGTSASLSPLPRLTLGLHRAIMFAGDEARFPTSFRQALRTIGGGIGGLGYDNQILSGELRLRLPTDSLLPLTGYVEWGMEDAAGAWRDVPGRVMGLLAPAVPGYPALQLGVEYAAFLHSCCGNSPWYRHWAFPANWALRDAPLGHPLGGNGREWRVHAEVDEPAADLHLSAQVFYRKRGDENLFVPGRVRSAGFSVSSSWRLLGSVDARLSLKREMSHSWSESDARAGVTVYYR